MCIRDRVWAHPQDFDLNPDGSPRVVAGVPPDYFSATGQRWGNPLYRWERMEAEGRATHGEADFIDGFRPASVLDAATQAQLIAAGQRYRPTVVPGTRVDLAVRAATSSDAMRSLRSVTARSADASPSRHSSMRRSSERAATSCAARSGPAARRPGRRSLAP